MRVILGILYCSTLPSQLANVQNTLIPCFHLTSPNFTIVHWLFRVQHSSHHNLPMPKMRTWVPVNLKNTGAPRQRYSPGSLPSESCQYGEYNSIIRIFTKTSQNLLKCHFFSPLVVLLPAPLWCEAVKHSTKLGSSDVRMFGK